MIGDKLKPKIYHKVTLGDEIFFTAELDNNRYIKLEKALMNTPFDEIEDFSSKNSKLYKFFIDLNEGDMEILHGGKISKMNFNEFAEVMFYENELSYLLKWKSKFDESFKKNSTTDNTENKLNKCLKYFTACDMYSHWILEESRFYSLPLILDALSEIEASYTAAVNYYYKQAVQLLRNFIELVVAQYYFSSNTSIYDDWRTKPNKFMPRFNGDTGMIVSLQKTGKINSNEEKRLENLFKKLSAYSHSRYEKLLHIDPETGKTQPFGFNERYLNDWLDIAIECMEIGLIILSKHTKDWEKQLENNEKLMCSQCHGKNFEVHEEKNDAKKLFLYTCKSCDNEIRMDVLIK